MPNVVAVNRAPVLTLWAAVVAERLGYPPETASTLGRFVVGDLFRDGERARCGDRAPWRRGDRLYYPVRIHP